MELNRPLSTITPTADGDVLTVLARSNALFTTGQLHRVLPKLSIEGIRKVLHRLTRQGIVRADKIGNAYAYRFNHDHLAAKYIAGLIQIPEMLLSRIEKQINSWKIAPIYAAIFGSAARGSMTLESDLDLILIRPDNIDYDLWERQVNTLTANITLWTGNDARPLEFTVAELAANGRDEPVLRDVLNDGLTVIGTHAWLATQLGYRN